MAKFINRYFLYHPKMAWFDSPDLAARVDRLLVERRRTSQLFEDDSFPMGIGTDAEVLIVGPGRIVHTPGGGKCLPMDSSVLYFPTYLAQGQGNVTVVDLPNGLGMGGGYRDWPAVKASLDHLRDSGAELAPYTFVEGDILDPNILEQTFDIINDHMTWQWVRPPGFMGTIQEEMETLARRYGALLKPGGRALLHFMEFHQRTFVPNLLRGFLAEGFEIKAVVEGVDDLYEMRDPIFREGLTALFPEPEKGEFYYADEGRFLRPLYNAYGCIVAEKPAE